MQLSQAFINKLPPGTNPDDVRLLKCAATIVDVEELEDRDLELANQYVAGPPLMNAEGKPTILKVVAWMAHEGVNRNRQAFVRDELQAVAPTLFKEPNFGVMDYNHSAVAYFSDDPTVVGLWYRAEYRYDDKAKRYGLLASGVMWSWLFPDHSDKLLANQARKGVIEFSMACIPMGIEFATDELGDYEILHNPVFFTVSALDIPPADEDATGLGSEDTVETNDGLQAKLLAMAAEHPWQTSSRAADNNSIEGVSMTTIEMLSSQIEELTKRVTENSPAAAEAIADFKQQLDEYVRAADESEAHLEEARQQIENLTTKVEEVDTARAAAITERDTALETIATLEKELETLKEFKAEIDAKKAEEDRVAELAARKAKLPAGYMEAHNKKSEEIRTKIEARWMAMSSEEFDLHVEELGYTPENVRMSYLERSRKEGFLPNFNGSTDELDGSYAGAIHSLQKRFGL